MSSQVARAAVFRGIGNDPLDTGMPFEDFLNLYVPRAAKEITNGAYVLDANDWKFGWLELNAGVPVTLMIEAGSLTPNTIINIIDLDGGGSVTAGDGITLIAPNGSIFAKAGSIGVLMVRSTTEVVLGGDVVVS